ncbi:MAG: 50S ribosomal protein L22 [Candidatus Kapaibacterium sp.]|nr:50S ribosomal protein L22 [Ignavibacteriota bacterium]MCB9221154.1 50S ribosomal protein L22 [Ignavibacteria bacterium]
MQARALKKYIKSSPRKMRLVIDLIRGKSAEEALNILGSTPNLAARMTNDVLRSAISNLNNKAKEEGMSYDNNEIVIKAIYSNQGPSMKRIRPAPMGRAFRIRKRTNHLTVELQTLDHNQSLLETENENSEG